MTSAITLALVLVVAVVIAWIRLLLRQRRTPAPRWRLASLLLLQPACAALLYLTLLPPEMRVEAGSMTVLTAGATGAQAAAQATGAIVVSLPEVPRAPDVEPVPDLATALRRHPHVTRLQVLGMGLDPRDRGAAQGRGIDFEPLPLPSGLVWLDGPGRTAPGAVFSVSGRVNALAGGQVRLMDPAGQVVDAALLAGEGEFHLRGYARAPGLATFSLQVLDDDSREVESADVPLHVADDPAPRVLLLSGAPNPEFRHLRRWAEDAGLELHVEVSVGRGVGLGDGPAPASAEGFGQFDLVVLDGRALGSLGVARRAALEQALAAGTGVLVRVDGPMAASVRTHLAGLGLAVTGDGGTQPVTLPSVDDQALLRARTGPGSPDAPFDPALAAEAPPELVRRALRPDANDAVPLLLGGADARFAWWRAHGRGRIGLWSLVDSHRLALGGRGDLHGELWSAAFTTLARPVQQAAPRFQTTARVGRRTAICGLVDGPASVSAPDGTESAVLVDPGAGPGACAGYWPLAPGWHLLRQGDDTWPFHVRPVDEAPGVIAATLRDDTLRLAGPGGATAAAGTGPIPLRRGPSWPWFFAWLVSAGLLWWLERRRVRHP